MPRAMPQARASSARKLMPRLAWGALGFNLAVIVWGAYVRASGSGAGCGRHWPLCNGEVIPSTFLSNTVIEFAHRVTSGGSLLLAALIAVVGWRGYPSGSAVRKASLATLGFTLTEALIGAALVLLRYVENDPSAGRVLSISLHLSNTFALLGALTCTAWWSSTSPGLMTPLKLRDSRPALIALAATLLVGVTGAITALGDTLFKAPSLAQGMAMDFAATSPFLVKLRVIHPIAAILLAAGLLSFADRIQQSTRFARALQIIVIGQITLGAINLGLLAPIPLQLVHLAVAECLWITLVLCSLQATQATQSAQASQSIQSGVEVPTALHAPQTAAPPPSRAKITASGELFASRLPPQAKVLLVQPPAELTHWLEQRELQPTCLDPTKDLRLMSLERESYDGIWLGDALTRHSIEDAQRIVASCFRGLKPRTGVLYAAYGYEPAAFESMLRQNGVQIVAATGATTGAAAETAPEAAPGLRAEVTAAAPHEILGRRI